MSAAAVRRGPLFLYSLLALPVAFAGFPLYVLAPDFYAVHYGLPLTLLGVILLGLRIFDAVQDPFIGLLSDRYQKASFWFMPCAGVILCAGSFALFNIRWTSPTAGFAFCMALAVAAYSVLSINLNALGALWTKDADNQTRIAAFRESFGLIGLVVAVSLPNALAHIVPEANVFFWFGMTLIALMAIGIACFIFWLRTASPNVERALRSKQHFWTILRSLPAETRNLFAIYTVSMLASSIPAVLVIFFVRDLLGAESYMGLFLLLYFLAGVLTMPLWKYLSARHGKHRAWLFSMLLAVASFAWAFFLKSGDTWQYGLICLCSGTALGADLTLPPSILADQLHARAAEDRAATHYSLLMLLSKASLALASAIALPLLGQAGFIPATVNTPSALLALSAAYAFIPCVFKLGAGALLYRSFICATPSVASSIVKHNPASGSHHHV